MKITRLALCALAALAFGIGEMPPAGQHDTPSLFGFVDQAGAVVGRPATPGSVAGVARRTLRRGAYVASIPHGCPLGTYYGYHLYYCGGVYYQRSGSGFVIVHF